MNTWLFFFAHPDDETVACGATIKQLSDAGEKVVVISATAGQAGQVMDIAQENFKKCGSLTVLRKQEFDNACNCLGVSENVILEFEDGGINNQDTWGALELKAVELIEKYQPDYVITFDHTGWYFHLDHVAVSIAVTRAFARTEHRPTALLHSLILMQNSDKWLYDFPVLQPTHTVKILDKEAKLRALQMHQSQDLVAPLTWLEDPKKQVEWYRLVKGDLSTSFFQKTK